MMLFCSKYAFFSASRGEFITDCSEFNFSQLNLVTCSDGLSTYLCFTLTISDSMISCIMTGEQGQAEILGQTVIF